MGPKGGTEILQDNLFKYCGADWQQRINLILSFTDPKVIDPNRINALWQHLYTDQGAAQGMVLPEFTDHISHYVYVSNWQLSEFEKHFGVERFTNHVIKNAIEPIEFKEKPRDKIRLIYTSTPDRGLEVLLDAWRIMNRKDIELVVYSSNIIYGKWYGDKWNPVHEPLFHKCKTTPGIIYRGYGTNKAVRTALQSSHILAYPSIYPETSCLAAIEAGAAGCKIVTTDYGALPETCNGWATHVPYSENKQQLAEHYADVLNKSIDNYWEYSYNIQQQSQWFNDYYSWERRSQEWQNFFNNICVK